MSILWVVYFWRLRGKSDGWIEARLMIFGGLSAEAAAKAVGRGSGEGRRPITFWLQDNFLEPDDNFFHNL